MKRKLWKFLGVNFSSLCESIYGICICEIHKVFVFSHASKFLRSEAVGKHMKPAPPGLPLLGWPADEWWPEIRLGKRKEAAATTGNKKKNSCRNNSAIVFWQLSWEVLIGRTKGCDFLVGYFLLCCMRVVFLTAQEQSSSLGTEWWLALTRAYKRYCRGTTSPSLGYWALLGAVRDQNNPSRYLGWRMGHLQQSRGRRAVAFDR